jgi:uncharacterized membrane protein YgcG
VIVRSLPKKYPLELYLFWLFNTAGLSEAAHKGSENRDILLLLDLSRKQAGITVGYGLVPYLPTATLDLLLGKAASAFAEQRWYDALKLIYNELDRLLETAAKQVYHDQGIATKIPTDARSKDY